MPANSVRRTLPPSAARALEEDPPPEGEARPEARPDPRGSGAGTCEEPPAAGSLRREDGRVLYRSADGGGETAVRLKWARPLSGRGDGPVSVMLAEKKREVAYFSSLDRFDAASRRIAEEELAAGMTLARITRVLDVKPRFGNYYWTVETDRGGRTFLMTSPENNCLRPLPDVFVLHDVNGNCFEINPVSGLDRASLREIDKVL